MHARRGSTYFSNTEDTKQLLKQSSQRTCDGVVITNYHKKKCPQLMQKDHRRLTRTLRMCNKQTLPTARGQETCAHRYSSLLPHTDDMPTSKAHTESKRVMVVNAILRKSSQYSSLSVIKCWKETAEDTIHYRHSTRSTQTRRIKPSDS